MSEIAKQKRQRALEEAANKLLGQKPLKAAKQVFEKGCANKKTMKKYRKNIARQIKRAEV